MSARLPGIRFLKSVEVLSLLKAPELKRLAGEFQTVRIKKRDILFHEGEEGHQLYIVRKGNVAISIKLPDGKELELVSFGPGDAFGEMSIFEDAPRSGSCTAKVDSELLSLPAENFFRLMATEPALATRIMYRLLNITTSRLRNTNSFLSDMVLWGEEARKRAITDELTGAYNRRFLDDTLPNYFSSAQTSGKPLAIVMSDLDYFRRINEEYGHAMGDKAIVEIVKAIRGSLREHDILARYGGDELLMIFPDTEKQTAFTLCEAIRLRVSSNTLFADMGGTIKSMSTSQGIAVYPDDASSLADLRLKADEALYKAKEGGRNRVAFH